MPREPFAAETLPGRLSAAPLPGSARSFSNRGAARPGWRPMRRKPLLQRADACAQRVERRILGGKINRSSALSSSKRALPPERARESASLKVRNARKIDACATPSAWRAARAASSGARSRARAPGRFARLRDYGTPRSANARARRCRSRHRWPPQRSSTPSSRCARRCVDQRLREASPRRPKGEVECRGRRRLPAGIGRELLEHRQASRRPPSAR